MLDTNNSSSLTFFLKKLNNNKFLLNLNSNFNFNFYNVLDSNVILFFNNRILYNSFFCMFYYTKIYNYYFLSSFFSNKWMFNSKFIFYVNTSDLYQKYSNKNDILQCFSFNNINHNTFLYLNHHSSSLSAVSDIIIPVSIFIEKSSKYCSLEGLIHQTRRINKKFNHVKYDWIFWLDLFLINYKFSYSSLTYSSPLLNFNFYFLLDVLNFKNYFFDFSFFLSRNFFVNNMATKVNFYLLVDKYLVFEFPYINFLNFSQKNTFFFFFLNDFFFINYICIGYFFKYSFFINNIINFNSNYLFNGYKKYISNNYSTILYNFKYNNFY